MPANIRKLLKDCTPPVLPSLPPHPSYDQAAMDPSKLLVSPGTSTTTVDIVYGLHPDSSTGGCVVQRSFEDSLLAEGVTSVRVHVASTAESAEQVFQDLQEAEESGERAEGCSRVLIIDGIALLFMRDRLHALKSPASPGGGVSNGVGRRRILVGFVHCPFR